jgi:hypothetical protein
MIKPHGLSESDLAWPGGRGDDGEGERTGSSWRAERRRRSAGVLKKKAKSDGRSADGGLEEEDEQIDKNLSN